MNTKAHEDGQPPAGLSVALGSACSACGMMTAGQQCYHPYAACLMMKACGNGNTVEANLRAVVEYGMKAHSAGIPLETAMSNISSVIEPNAEAQPPAEDSR